MTAVAEPMIAMVIQEHLVGGKHTLNIQAKTAVAIPTPKLMWKKCCPKLTISSAPLSSKMDSHFRPMNATSISGISSPIDVINSCSWPGRTSTKEQLLPLRKHKTTAADDKHAIERALTRSENALAVHLILVYSIYRMLLLLLCCRLKMNEWFGTISTGFRIMWDHLQEIWKESCRACLESQNRGTGWTKMCVFPYVNENR